MSVLSDGSIRSRLHRDGGLTISPVESLDAQLQPASIELRVGSDYKHHASGAVLDASDVTEGEEVLTIESGEFYHLHSLEEINLPPDLQAELTGLFSNSSRGLNVLSGVYDPGWNGYAKVPVVNMSERDITIRPGQQVFKMVFRELDNPAQAPYNGD